VIPAIWKVEVGGSWPKDNPRQKQDTLHEKQTKAKRVWGMPQFAELSSNPSSTKKTKQNKKPC
jgi:hypothetical protein